MDLSDLRNKHFGQMVWVVASDATLDYFPENFWERRCVITINEPHVPSWYCVSKNDAGDQYLQDRIDAHPKTQFVVSQHRYGNINHQRTNLQRAIVFPHRQNRVSLFDPAHDIPKDREMLLVSFSTLGSALHLAAYMGAHTCFVVGASGGEFGGKVYVGDYSQHATSSVAAQTSRQTQGICDELQRRYGTYFVTVLPWANMRLGGVTFTSEYGRIN